MTLSQLVVWFAHRRGPYTSANVIRRELGDVGHLLEHLVSLKLLNNWSGKYRLVYQARYRKEEMSILCIDPYCFGDYCGLKHEETRVESFPQPEESKGSILRRLHDQAVVGNTVTIDGEEWVKREDGIERVPERDAKGLKECPTCKAPVFIRENKRIVAHYTPKGKRCTANEAIYRDSYPLWIYIRAWERHESTTVEVRDYLRAVWRSAGYATAVGR